MATLECHLYFKGINLIFMGLSSIFELSLHRCRAYKRWIYYGLTVFSPSLFDFRISMLPMYTYKCAFSHPHTHSSQTHSSFSAAVGFGFFGFRLSSSSTGCLRGPTSSFVVLVRFVVMMSSRVSSVVRSTTSSDSFCVQITYSAVEIRAQRSKRERMKNERKKNVSKNDNCMKKRAKIKATTKIKAICGLHMRAR